MPVALSRIGDPCETPSDMNTYATRTSGPLSISLSLMDAMVALVERLIWSPGTVLMRRFSPRATTWQHARKRVRVLSV